MISIVRRELLVAMRQRRIAAILLTLMAGFAIIVLLRWPSHGRVDLSAVRAVEVFQMFAYTLLASVLLVIPAFPASAIVHESRRGTLALLLNSPMSALGIYSGKLASSVIYAVLVLMTSLPAAAACYAMGGIDLFNQLLLLYGVLLAATFQYITAALLVSSIARTSDSAVRATYGCVFTLAVFALGPEIMTQGKDSLLATAASWFRAGSPIPAMMEIVGHTAVDRVGGLARESTLGRFFFVVCSSSVVFGMITLSRINFRILGRGRWQGKITQDRSIWIRIARRLTYLIDPNSRKLGIPFFVNPVMVKEFRTRRFGRFHWLMRIIAGCAVLSLILALAATMGTADWGAERMGGILVLMQMTLVVLVVPALTAGLISTERETGGWDILRMTPMSSFRIVHGKLASVLWTVGLILMATLPGYYVMTLIDPGMWLQVRQVLVCLLLNAMYTICVGAAVGSLFRKTTSATIGCYVVLIALFLVPLLIWMGRDAPFSYTVVRYALLVNPTGAAMSIIEAPGFAGYNLYPTTIWVSVVASATAFFVLIVQIWRISRPL